jgi:hypothetical protein
LNVLRKIKKSQALRGMQYFFRRLTPPPPHVVEIETTTFCNLKCHYCPNYTVGRPPHLMEERTFYKIIDSLKQQHFTGMISPHFYGEPLTDSRLESFLQYVHVNLPFATIKLYTNGELLTVPRYLALKSAGVSSFLISQHTESPSDTIKHTLSYIKDHHPDLFTVDYVDHFNNHTMKWNRGGLVNITPVKIYYCNLVNQMTFDYLGNAVLCCNDYLSTHVFGNINDKGTYQIWNDKKYIKVRSLIANGFLPYEICKICTGTL